MGLGIARSCPRRSRLRGVRLEGVVSDTTPSNNLSWRVTVLEREVDRLKEGKPDVVAERVTRLSADVEHLRRDMHDEMEAVKAQITAVVRILIGAFVTIATGLVVAYIVNGGSPVSG